MILILSIFQTSLIRKKVYASSYNSSFKTIKIGHLKIFQTAYLTEWWLDITLLVYRYYFFLPKISDITDKIKKPANKILAMPAALPAIPPKPNTAAIIAMIKKTIE